MLDIKRKPGERKCDSSTDCLRRTNVAASHEPRNTFSQIHYGNLEQL